MHVDDSVDENLTSESDYPLEIHPEIKVEMPIYRVLTLGGPGVGKTALTQQFMTSEYMAAQNTSFGKSSSGILTCSEQAVECI